MAALGFAPAAAQATVTSSQITSWVSVTTDSQGHTSTITNGSYLISLDNPPTSTTVTVSGTAVHDSANDRVDIACFYGSSASSVKLMGTFPLTGTPNGTFNTGALQLRPIAGHACRLRAVQTNKEGPTTDLPPFAGPNVAISESALPSSTLGGKASDFYVNAVTFTGNAAWASAGSPTNGCGPAVAPLGPEFDITGNFAINCMGSLQGSDLPTGGDRSEVQVDGQNAYDAASAAALIGDNGDLQNFPSLKANVDEDPLNGLVSSQSTEGWVICPGLLTYPPESSTCLHFAAAGIELDRDIATSDGGDVITMTDTWRSVDGNAHSLDLLYDDSVGATSRATQRGYQFPGQSSFSAYGSGASVPPPGTAPQSILVRSNLAAPDGAPSEAVGAVTFAEAPSDFTFVSNGEFQEHHALQIPASGSTSLTYIYSTAYTIVQTQALALAAQDRLQPLAVAVTAPADGAMTSTSPVTVTGTARAGSGISSLVIAGQTVPVAPDGTWSVNVALNPGPNTLGLLATDAAGNSAQGQLTIVYQPPPAPLSPPPPSAVRCKVPRTKGMKLLAAERALRRAHCNVGRIKHLTSKKLAQGRVMSTTPRAGRRLAAGTKVELFISKGS